jgi:surfeit locus 1 family protein
VRFRKPTFLTAALGLVCLAILLSLGFWQLDRREWKQDLTATINKRLEKFPAPIPADPGQDWEYRPVLVSGEVVPESWFRFPGRSQDGQVGDVLMLLVREETGRLIVVEQAFVGFNEALPPLPAAIGREGVLRPPLEPGWFTPDNNPAANQWYTVDPPAMAAAAGVEGGSVLPYFMAGKDWRPHLPDNHLQYAITWFSFAAVFVIIFILFHRKRPEKPAS